MMPREQPVTSDTEANGERQVQGTTWCNGRGGATDLPRAVRYSSGLPWDKLAAAVKRESKYPQLMGACEVLYIKYVSRERRNQEDVHSTYRSCSS